MPTTGSSTIAIAQEQRSRLALSRPQGWRAVIDFAPKPTSPERICAGVVTRAEDGKVDFKCAIDSIKAEHAFGSAGTALYCVAQTLCESLAEHWQANPSAEQWIAPFEQAHIAQLSRFSARNTAEAHESILNRTSSLQTLLAAYEIKQKPSRQQGIAERVRSVIQKDTNSKHLAKRFIREIPLGEKALPLKVDFLGQHFACYFLQISTNLRGMENNLDRAYGKLFELRALRKFIKKPRKSMGLLDDERPQAFELVMVGDRDNPVQRQAIYQVEALADKDEVIAKVTPSVSAAAEHLAYKERMAA